jgi:integrase
MPITKFKRGKNWYLRGTVTVGDRSESIYTSTGVSDEGQAEIIRTRTESRLTDELLLGKKHMATFQEAMVSYGDSGGSNRFLAPINEHFGSWRLKDIAQTDLDKAARKLYPRVTPETLNRQVYTPFIAVWNHAVLNEWCDMRKWQRPRKVKGTNVTKLAKRRAGTHPVDYDRAARFVSVMSPAPAMLMTALFYTGMRPIEIFSLEAGDVNIKGRWITLSKSKTGEPRGVPMHEFIVPLFEGLAKRGGVLFRTFRGEAYSPKDDGGGQMKAAINGARGRLRRMGTPIDDIAPYTGRHSVSTQLVVNGVHPHIKDQILGHAVTDMSRHYTNVPQAPLIEAINTLPVPELWRSMEWWADPLAWTTRLADGQGRRTDLEKEKRA